MMVFSFSSNRLSLHLTMWAWLQMSPGYLAMFIQQLRRAASQRPAVSFLKILQIVSSNISYFFLSYVYITNITHSYDVSFSLVPTNYSYLPNQSILRPVFDFLVTAGKTGKNSLLFIFFHIFIMMLIFLFLQGRI